LSALASTDRDRVGGDHAEARHDLPAVHIPDRVHPERHADVGGFYCCSGICTANGWKFTKARLEILWNAGADFALAQHDEAASSR
jgi:hypothetical protein